MGVDMSDGVAGVDRVDEVRWEAMGMDAPGGVIIREH